MLKYTIAAIQIFSKFIKKIANVLKIIGTIFSGVYFSLALFLNIGNKIVNIILASIFVISSIFTLCTLNKEKTFGTKLFKKSIKWIRFGVRAFALGATIYGIYEAQNSANGISIILAIFNIFIWVLQVLVEITTELLTPKFKLLYAAILKDIEPVNNILNVGNALKGNERNDLHLEKYEKELSQLDVKVEENRAAKEERNRLFKLRRKEERKTRKNNKDSQ